MRYLKAGFASALLLVSPMSSIALQGEGGQAQMVQDRKAEGDRQFEQGHKLLEQTQNQGAIASLLKVCV